MTCQGCNHSSRDHHTLMVEGSMTHPCSKCPNCDSYEEYKLEGEQITGQDIRNLLVICGSYLTIVPDTPNDGLEKYRKTCSKIMQNIEQLEESING